jgi:hypothetical protein
MDRRERPSTVIEDLDGQRVRRFEAGFRFGALALSISIARGRSLAWSFALALAVFLIGAIDQAPAQDTAPPETLIEESPKPMAGSTNPAFKFSSPSPVGGTEFECRIDGGLWEGCTSPKRYTGLSEGSHRFWVKAKDEAGASDQTPAVHDWVIDASGPVVQLSGSLKDAVDAGDPLLGPTYELQVSANDGADPSSGVKSIEVLLDDGGVAVDSDGSAEEFSAGPLDSEQLPCPQGECSLSLNTIFKAEDVAGGDHTIRVLVKDQLGRVTEESLTVPVPDDQSRTAVPDTLRCTGSNENTNFGVYSLGPMFEGLAATGVKRECDQTEPGVPVRRNSVTYTYGEPICNPEGVAAEDTEACSWPLQIQTWPACERTRSDYKLIPHVPYPRQDLGQQRGVPASGFEDLSRVELYTGNSTVVIFGADPGQAQRAIAAVRAEPPTAPSMPTVVSGTPSSTLPAPVPDAITGELTCP